MGQVDTGYAWVIPFACCFIQATLFGSYRSYGLLYKVILDTFNVSRSDASWPFSLCMTVIHLTGPISGSLNRFLSVRSISFMGCALSALGVGVCFFAQNVTHITLGIGVLQGFGIGLTYVQNNHIINQYFEKYRGTANGISLSGGTIGAFILSPLIEYSVGKFPLNQSFLFLSIITLLTLPVCLLLKPFHRSGFPSSVSDTESTCSFSLQKEKSLNRKKPNEISENAPHYLDSNILSVYLKSYSVDGKQFTDNKRGLIPYPLPSSNATSTTTLSTTDSSKDGNNNSGSSSDRSDSPRPGSSNESLQEETSTWESVKSIMSNKYFLLIAFTHMAYFWGSITFTLIIVDLAMDKGIQLRDTVHLISAFSAGDLIGRLGSGFVLDRKIFSLKKVSLLTVAGIGVSLVLTPYVNDLVWLLILSASLGLLSGLVNVLLNLLFCEYMGPEQAGLSFGLSAFLSGLVTISRPWVVGHFRDQDGSYNGLFLVMAGLCFGSAVCWLLEGAFSSEKKKPIDPSLGHIGSETSSISEDDASSCKNTKISFISLTASSKSNAVLPTS